MCLNQTTQQDRNSETSVGKQVTDKQARKFDRYRDLSLGGRRTLDEGGRAIRLLHVRVLEPLPHVLSAFIEVPTQHFLQDGYLSNAPRSYTPIESKQIVLVVYLLDDLALAIDDLVPVRFLEAVEVSSD